MSPDTGIACSFRVAGDEPLFQALQEAARAAQRCGVTSWWSPGDREVVTERSHEPTLGLHVIARAAEDLRIVVSGDIPSLYSAPVRAKQIASLDWFTNGRLEHGIDLEAPPTSLEDPLRPFSDDGLAHVIEQTAAMHELWTHSRATYRGSFLSFEGAISLPKPMGDRIPVTHLRATSATALESYAAACGAPGGWVVWSPSADDVVQARQTLVSVLAHAADGVRLVWVVPAAEFPAAFEQAPSLGVDEVVAYFDRIPSPHEIEMTVQ